MRTRNRHNRTPKPQTVTERLRALRAACHLDTSYGFADTPGVGSTWTDRISGVVLASESSAKRMIYDASSDLNGRPGWVGTAADQTAFLEPNGARTLGAYFCSESPYTLFVVRVVPGTNASVLVAAEGTGIVAHSLTSAENLSVERYDGTYAYYTSPPVTVGPAVDAFVFTGSGRVVSAYSNGVSYGSGSVAANTHASLRFMLGANADSATFSTFFEGTYGDVVLFPRALATTERQGVEAMLMAKFGIV